MLEGLLVGLIVGLFSSLIGYIKFKKMLFQLLFHYNIGTFYLRVKSNRGD